MTKVYLAGPITGLTYGSATDWRQSAGLYLAQFGIVALSPMRGKDFILRRLGATATMGQTYEDAPLSTQRGIVARDTFDIKRADVVLFNLLGAERVSIGSMVEYGWASAHGKVIVTVMEKEGNVHDHAFVRELSPYRVDNLDDALEIIKAIAGTLRNDSGVVL